MTLLVAVLLLGAVCGEPSARRREARPISSREKKIFTFGATGSGVGAATGLLLQDPALLLSSLLTAGSLIVWYSWRYDQANPGSDVHSGASWDRERGIFREGVFRKPGRRDPKSMTAKVETAVWVFKDLFKRSRGIDP